MSTSKYIRPMGFFETLGVMFQLYAKIVFPILGLNILLDYATLGFGLFAGIFVGPVLIMTSDAILGRRPNVWQSIVRTSSTVRIFKIALASLSYLALVFAIVFPLIYFSTLFLFAMGLDSLYAAIESFYYLTVIFIYNFLTPLWIFIPIIMLLEKKGLRASLRRMFQIVRRNFARIFLMDLFINLLLTVVLFLIYGLLVGWLSYNPDSFAVTIAAIFAILAFATTGLNALPYVFVYYEYRARHENYSEELLAQELGYQPIEEMMTV